MDLLKMLSDLGAAITDLQNQLEAAKALAVTEYDRGFAKGVKSTQGEASDKIYSQAELDAKLEEAIDAVSAEIESLKAELEATKASVEPKIEEAIKAFKADLLAKYEEQQVAESESETGFAALLK